jgi:gliding motility-associated-like protein
MSGSIVVGQPSSALTLSQTTTHVSCYGGTNGYINLSATGGTPGYAYVWSNTATTQDLSNISSGGYSVVVTDANGCTSNLSVLVNQPSSLVSVSGTVSNVLCFGGTTGSITSTGQGGTSPYSYAWSNGETTSQVNGLSAGLYTVTVSDANGCTATQTWGITQPSALSLQSTNTNILCYGQSSGSITSQASGGVTPYSYTWTNGMTGSNLLNLPAGPYFVTVVDGNGCSATFSDTVYQPATALTLSTSIVNNNCFGAANGTIDNTVSGGTSPYQYQWSNGPTTQDLSNLLAGTYVITIMDANGCLLNNSLQVTQPPISIVASLSQVNVSCLGGGNGSINLTASGTGAPFTYLWNNGSTTQDISGLVPGVYTVGITDNSGCTTNLSANITQPSTSVGLQSLVTNVLCTGNNTGAIDLTVSGGTTPYFYSWSNGSGNQDLNNVLAGTYSVIITDNNNCQVFDTLTITEPSNILTGTITQTNVQCFGQATGAIDLTMTGGTVGYSYVWSNTALSQDLTGVAAGFYSVIVTDGNGCTFNTSAIITEPVQGVQITSNITNVDCFGNSTGAINLTLSGGLSPYSFLWSNAATTEDIASLTAGTYILQTIDGNGCFSQTSYQVTQATQPLGLSTLMTPEGCYGGNNGGLNLTVVGGTGPFTYAWTGPATYTSSTEDIQNVFAGIYSVTVTDANGCSAQLSDTVVEPTAYALSHVITNVDCFGNSTGSVNLTVNGGTPSYAYNWNNGTTTQDLSGILSGTYSVVVTDLNGCTLYDTVSITQPAFATSLSSVVSNVSCQGGLNGSLDLTVVSANTGLTYLWNNQAVTQDLTNLGAGTYTVSVTDANGCVNTLSSTVSQPAVLTLSNTTINPLCTDSLNGSIDLSVAGGTSPYTYLWNTTATTQDISGLLEGTYFVTVTDTNGCSATSSIVLVDPSPITSSYTSLPAQCYGGSNGSVNVTVSGGTPGYTYVWNSGSTNEDLSNVSAGNDTLVITDIHGCTHTQVVTIGQPTNPITIASVITNIGCFGTSTGAIDITVTGGTPGYTYQWNNTATTQDLSGITNGTYFVNVFDANGCTETDTFAILVPLNPLAISLVGTGINCFNGATGSIDMTITGGVGPYLINWNTGSTNEDVFGLPVGTYSVTVVDANGCTASGSLLLNGPTAPLLVSGTTTNVSCFGAATGAVDITVTGGSAPYAFSWSNTATSEDLVGITNGVYTVNITDFNGCTTSGTYSITQPTSGAVISYNVQDVSCFGGTNGSINVNVVGGTLPYTYFWTNNAATTQDLFGISSAVYTLNVFDDSSCVTIANISVNQPIQAVTPSTVISAVSCYGFSNGSIDLSVVGGTPGYSYLWSTGATTEDISGLVAGTYTVTITDANSCVSTHTYVVTQPLAPLTLNTSQVNVLCYGNASGFVNLITSGGTSPYSYAWSNTATTEDIFNLIAGTYTVDVTDFNGCTATTQATITQPAAGISLQETHVNVSCYGANNGSINITPSGGTPGASPAYSYLWSNTATTEDLVSLIAGTYTVLVTDNVGCSYTQSIVVSQPLAPLVATPTITNLICYGAPEGAIDITMSGGTAPYVYYWNTGATTEDLSGLLAGSYSLAVTDANSCVTSIVVAVSEPASPLTVSYFTTPASCYGYADGTVLLNITGGAPSYDILWSNGDTTNFIDSLLAGTYSAQITDANGCDAVINAIISQPQALIADFNIDATFGCAPLTVNLLNTSVGAIASSTWNFGNGSVSTGTNASYTYTQGGCYGISLTVMSPTGCLATTSIDSLVCVVTGPTAGFAATTTDIDYFTGQLELVNTSQGAITNYMWSFGDASPNSTLENPIHYYPAETVDSYIVSLMVTDTNGCVDTVSNIFYLNEMLNVYVPNAITINSDGLNELFLPIFSNVDAVKEYDLWIYNRWGQIVFTTDEIAEGWNGRYKDNKDVQLGTYTWKIRYVDNLGEAKTQIGHVTILR